MIWASQVFLSLENYINVQKAKYLHMATKDLEIFQSVPLVFKSGDFVTNSPFDLAPSSLSKEFVLYVELICNSLDYLILVIVYSPALTHINCQELDRKIKWY